MATKAELQKQNDDLRERVKVLEGQVDVLVRVCAAAPPLSIAPAPLAPFQPSITQPTVVPFVPPTVLPWWEISTTCGNPYAIGGGTTTITGDLHVAGASTLGGVALKVSS